MQVVHTPSKRNMLLADAGLLYASIIWGATFFVVKDALAGVDPITMVGYRFLIAGLALLVWMRIKGQSLLVNWREGVYVAVVQLVLYITQTVGLKYTTAANSGFITGLFVFFVPLFLILFFKRRPTIMEAIASAVSLVGLWILTGGLTDINIGDGLTMICATAYALHLLLSDKYMKAGVDPIRISCQQFLFVGVASLCITGATTQRFEVANAATWGVIVFLALFPTLSAFVIQMFAQRFTSPLRVSLIFAFEPVFAALFAWTLGGEHASAHAVWGGFFIVAALILSGLRWPVRQTSRTATDS